MKSMTEEEIRRLIDEGGNATLPEIDIPKAFLVQDSGSSKVFICDELKVSKGKVITYNV